MKNAYQIIVMGGGHAGCEAALASARMEHDVLLIVANKDRIANMPCNPHIGGPAKGIIVREIDALGGEMGRIADKAMLQIKMLNSSKGPAVQCLRAQVDKIAYARAMQAVIASTPRLDVLEAVVTGINESGGHIKGVRLEDGTKISCEALIIASGTYLDSCILTGDECYRSGPDNERTTSWLSRSLKAKGIPLIRLKTGTPPRIQKDTIDYDEVTPQYGDSDRILKFSEDTRDEDVLPFSRQALCWLTHTTEETHRIIREHLHESSMYSGLVKGIGPRYCPSIEDKVVRFADKSSHQLFLEPESRQIDEIYISGLSTSLPHYVQDLLIPTIPGLSHAVIRRYAYAIEYDAIDPLALKPSLESKAITDLYFAGQVNGTSGYEEAAGQGIIAGINAASSVQGQAPLVLGRNQAYIGVLIDDLVTKGVRDPYRMFTSRAEYRLLLRHDNAEERLITYAMMNGLESNERREDYNRRHHDLFNLENRLMVLPIYPTRAVNDYLHAHGLDPLVKKVTADDFLKRPHVTFTDIEALTGETFTEDDETKLHALTECRYAGYIAKECRDAERMKDEEDRVIPADLDWNLIPNLASEAREKLIKVAPVTLGQASRISGVNPADVAIIAVWLEAHHGA